MPSSDSSLPPVLASLNLLQVSLSGPVLHLRLNRPLPLDRRPVGLIRGIGHGRLRLH